jgi:preprotein translocase subunit YajC
VILSLLLTLSLVLADSKVLVEGIVVSIDEKTITLKQDQGSLVKIPRSSIATTKGIRVGKDEVHVLVKPIDFVQMNPKALSKKKNPVIN